MVCLEEGRGEELGPGGRGMSRRVLDWEGGGTVLVLVLELPVEPYVGLSMLDFDAIELIVFDTLPSITTLCR